MSHPVSVKRKTIADFIRQKGQAPLVCLTSYTAPVARIADRHADLILVGDSLGMVLYGMDSTLPVTLDMMANHGRAVVSATERAFVVVDMPFGSYQQSAAQAFQSAALIMKETGATAVKLEGGAEMAETVAFLTCRGIPVMGHIGLQPQSVHAAGGYRVMGRDNKEWQKIKNDARAVANAGAFGIVLECLDPDLALEITEDLPIPTIGIGASAACDGQILVTEDMLGLSGHKVPKFVKQYANLSKNIEEALFNYSCDVKARNFPEKVHTYEKRPTNNRPGTKQKSL